MCLPAKKENSAMEETFQEPLTRVGVAPFSYWSHTFSLHLSHLFSSSSSCLSGSASALYAAGQCGETGGNSGTAVSHHRSHISVGPDQSGVETPGLSCPKGGLCCGNKQHCPMSARLDNIISSLWLPIKWIIRFQQECIHADSWQCSSHELIMDSWPNISAETSLLLVFW